MAVLLARQSVKQEGGVRAPQVQARNIDKKMLGLTRQFDPNNGDCSFRAGDGELLGVGNNDVRAGINTIVSQHFLPHHIRRARFPWAEVLPSGWMLDRSIQLCSG